jgi:hypothetical protein
MAKSQEKKATEVRVCPMDLQVGDRLTAVTGEWEVIGQPFSTAAGKTVHARVRDVSDPPMTDLRTWEANERVSVTRAAGAGESTR